MISAALTSAALAAFARFGYVMADEKRWLPRFIYNQRALRLLREGDLDAAGREIDSVLVRKPDDERAQLIGELIAMRRDARDAGLNKAIEWERRCLHRLKERIERHSRTLSSGIRRERLLRIVPLPMTALVAAPVWITPGRAPMWSVPLFAALLLVALIWTLRSVRFRRESDQMVMAESRAAIEILNREMAMHRLRLVELQTEKMRRTNL